jgi:hypothetical protein
VPVFAHFNPPSSSGTNSNNAAAPRRMRNPRGRAGAKKRLATEKQRSYMIGCSARQRTGKRFVRRCCGEVETLLERLLYGVRCWLHRTPIRERIESERHLQRQRGYA